MDIIFEKVTLIQNSLLKIKRIVCFLRLEKETRKDYVGSPDRKFLRTKKK